MTLPLEGLRVIDLSSLLPGGLCGRMLGDLGADVLKIENPRNPDGFRSMPPLVKTMGSFYHIVGRNKRSMTLDIRHPEGRDILLRMIPKADVLIDSFRTGMDRDGIGYETLREINPRLVQCSITSYGQDGPYRDYPAHDINLLALSGVLDLLGEKGGPPVTPGVQIGGPAGGLTALIGILAALLKRERTGRGEYVDAALLDGLAPFLGLVMSTYMTTGILPERGKTLVGGGFAFYRAYETADGGYLAVGCLKEKFWRNFCMALGREDLIDLQFDEARRDEVIAEVSTILKQRSRREWMELFSGFDLCVSPVNTLEEALQDPQIQYRGTWFRERHPLDGDVPQQRFPVKFSDDPPRRWRSHPPSLGEHTREILRDMGYDDGAMDDLAARGVI
ncbi:MAG: CoA transferase [Syntrophales bacterium]|jgi:crotonobetainyl-CoA:carnitine CoA-transferase CaiB-like acyl-CoA transferase|nr:CoA transferase [Syntrophales bacterium]MCK9528927.1 CoA transferase [Syntrophales bacterium]MDX9921079.1 CaiB/BaiF CoA-transferase family protein [Syntrophales bacterium]